MKCGTGLARLRVKANSLSLLVFLLIFAACKTGVKDPEPFDWQGHRGARGEAPENTSQAMLRALQEGVRTLEMDVVVSRDSVVLLSHEPWFNPEICLDFDGKEWADTADRNLYHFDYAQIAQCDCGSKENSRFPGQEHFKATKPRLLDVILAVEEASLMMARPEPYYNIEIKSRPEWDSIYYPSLRAYIDAVLDVLEIADLGERLIIQSFDSRALNYLRERKPNLRLAFLTEDGERSPAEQIKELGFVPEIYSCHYTLLDAGQVRSLQSSGLKVIPWTVNEIEDAQKLLDWGVDGIITDYPARMIGAFANPQ